MKQWLKDHGWFIFILLAFALAAWIGRGQYNEQQRLLDGIRLVLERCVCQ